MSAIPLALRLVQARQLAESGRADEAERLLAPAPSTPPSEPLALQTLAVIVTRRGDYPRARRLWQQLERVQPGHPEATAMLTAIDDWTERPGWMRFTPPPVLVGAPAVLLLALAWLAFAPSRPTAEPAPAFASPSAPVAAPVTPLAPVPAYAATTTALPPPRPATAPHPAAHPAADEDAEAATVSFSVKPAKKR